jgi:serine/threonine protein kinase
MADQTALPSEGDLLAGKYRIQRKLGVGGMGAVFEARHEVTGRRFAIKWLLQESRGEGTERFVREARFAGGLEHPNVIDVYDVCEEAGAVFLVMELLEGETLAARLVQVGNFSATDALRIALPWMRGVARAHAAGIVHRDLKPANLFICAATNELPERFKVLDFGISKIIGVPGEELSDSLTHSGSLMGTPFYMAPEQLRGRTVDHRADIYAFGVILYQMLSGRLPFMAATFGDLVVQVLTETPAPLGELAADAPAELIRVVERAMARRPEQRFESMLQLVAALEHSAGAASALPASVSEPPKPVSTSAYAEANHKTRPIATSSGIELPASQPSAASDAGGSSVSGRAPIEAQLTPLSTESRPPPEPAGGPRHARPRPIVIAAIASAAVALLGVLAYWLSPTHGNPNTEPHVVQPLPEAESSVSASTQPEPSAVPDLPDPEDTARPDESEVRPLGPAPATPVPATARDRAGLRPWPAAEGGKAREPAQATKPAAAPAARAGTPAAKTKPKSKTKPQAEARHIDMNPRQF